MYLRMYVWQLTAHNGGEPQNNGEYTNEKKMRKRTKEIAKKKLEK